MYRVAPGPGANPFEEVAMDLITQLPKNGTSPAPPQSPEKGSPIYT
jgi:hypothetical protein